MTKDEALKLALTALEINQTLLEKITPYKGQEDLLSDSIDITQNTITAIKEALAQPEQEPVRIMGFNCKCGRRMEVSAEQGVVPAPQRKHLSTEEIEQCCYETDNQIADHPQTWKWTEGFARAIEAKLKEKNT